MAEAVGLAASVGGLVGLTGQIFQICLFLKNFFEDAKAAPKDVHDLREEINTLTNIAEATDSLVQRSKELCASIKEDQVLSALKQCATIVEEVGGKIAQNEKCLVGEKWWERIKVATRKKAMAKYLKKLESAKSLIQMGQGNLMIALQHVQQESSDATKRSVNQLRCQGEAAMVSVEQQSRVVGTFPARFDKVDNTMDHIKSGIDNLAPWQAVSPGALDKLIKAAFNDLLQQHMVQFGPKVHEYTPLNNGGDHASEIYGTGEEFIGAVHNAQTSPGIMTENASNGSGSFITRKSQVVFQSRYQLALFEIEVSITNVRHLPGGKSTFAESPQNAVNVLSIQRFIVVRLFGVWKRNISFTLGHTRTPYYGSPMANLQTYNHVPWNSPIFTACQDWDLVEVRRLFDQRLASPFDQDDYGYLPVDTVFSSLMADQEKDGKNAAELLKYLLGCMGGKFRKPSPMYLLFKWIDQTKFISTRAEALRLAICNSSEDPFGNFPSTRVPLGLSESMIGDVLFGQQEWSYDRKPLINGYNHFIENERHIFEDPAGKLFEEALAKGLVYVPFSGNQAIVEQPLHGLLQIARVSTRDNVKEGCMNRLSILLRRDGDPRELCCRKYRYSPRGLTSATGFAIYIGLEDFWSTTLKMAGWSDWNCKDLFNEEFYLGIPELLCGERSYLSREECRADFVHKLRTGAFLADEPQEDTCLQSMSVIQLGENLALYSHYVREVIQDANRSFKLQTTPGCWPGSKSENLMPGLDFDLPYDKQALHRPTGDMTHWPCVRHIWKDELNEQEYEALVSKYWYYEPSDGQRNRLPKHASYVTRPRTWR